MTSSIVKMHSHLYFIEKCKEKSAVPKGLQVKIQCNALLADLTNIGHRFKEIKHRAEEDFVEALTEHYELTISKLEAEERILTTSMNKICQDLPDPKIIGTHQALLEKTKDNLSRHKKTLEEKKLEALEAPQPKKPRPNSRPQRRGMSSKNTNPPPTSHKDTSHNKPKPTDNGPMSILTMHLMVPKLQPLSRSCCNTYLSIGRPSVNIHSPRWDPLTMPWPRSNHRFPAQEFMEFVLII